MKGINWENSLNTGPRLSKGRREYHVPESQGILRAEEKAKMRRQLVVVTSRWSALLLETEKQ